MKVKTLCAATAALLAVSSVARAQIEVDGNLDAAYGDAKSHVVYDPAAPTSNFGAPGPTTSGQAYSIYLASDTQNVYGFIQPNVGGTSAGDFANLYFDLDPANGNGSDLGFEVTNSRAFVAGQSGYAPAHITVANGSDGSIEFAIPNTDFTAPIPGLSGYPNASFPSTGDAVVLRLSQSLGYSVAGGESYGPDRLGSVDIGGDQGSISAAPEPGTWALMMLGVGLVGAMLGFRRRAADDHRAKPALIA